MNIEVFAYKGPPSGFWGLWTKTDQMELEIQDWLAKNPRITVHELKHDLVQNLLTAPQ